MNLISILHKTKKIIKKTIKCFIIIIAILYLLYNGLIMCYTIHHHYTSANISSMIKSDPFVLDVELTNHKTIGYDFYIKILFNDGGSITVDRVDKKGKGHRIFINDVNGYSFRFVDDYGRELKKSQVIKLWSTLIGVQLETVVDIVKNYPKISILAENSTNLDDYRQDNEIFLKTLNRVIFNKLYSDVVIFDGQEYALLKYLDITAWPLSTRNQELSEQLKQEEDFLNLKLKDRTVELIKNIPNEVNLATIWNLNYSKSFKEMQKYSHELIYIFPESFNDCNFSIIENEIIAFAIQNVDFDYYRYFLVNLSESFKDGKIDESIVNICFFPKGWSHAIIENYRDPVIISAFNTCLENENISLDFKKNIELALKGKLWKNYKKSAFFPQEM